MKSSWARATSSSETPNFNLEEKLTSGYLEKKGSFRKNWKRRYFVLYPGLLQFKESDKEDSKLIGEIVCTGCTVSSVEEPNDRYYYLHLQQGSKVLDLRTDEGKKIRDDWISELKKSAAAAEPAAYNTTDSRSATSLSSSSALSLPPPPQQRAYASGAEKPEASLELKEIRLQGDAEMMAKKVKELAKFSSAAKRYELEQNLVSLRRHHIGIYLFEGDAAGDIVGSLEDLSFHVGLIEDLVDAGANLSSSASQFQAAVATLGLAYEAMALLDKRCRLAKENALKEDHQGQRGERGRVQDAIKRLRTTIKKAKRPLSKSPNVCYSALLLHVAALEVTETALPDRHATKKMAKAAFRTILGAAKCAVTMTPNEDLLKGLSSAFSLGAEAYQRKHAAVLAAQLGDMATMAAYFRQQPFESEPGVFDVHAFNQFDVPAFKQSIYDRSVVFIGPSPAVKRWEGAASFALMLAEIILGIDYALQAAGSSEEASVSMLPDEADEATKARADANAKFHEVEDTLIWLWEGDDDGEDRARHPSRPGRPFGGLAQMLSFGDEPKKVASPMYDLVIWASGVASTELPSWLDTGIHQLVSQCEEQSVVRAKDLVRKLQKQLQDRSKKQMTSVAAKGASGRAIETLEEINKCLKAPQPLLEYGRSILEKFANLSMVGMLKAKFLQVLRYPVDLLQSYLKDHITGFKSKFEKKVSELIQLRTDSTDADTASMTEADERAARFTAGKEAMNLFIENFSATTTRLGVVLRKENLVPLKTMGKFCVKERQLDSAFWSEFITSFEAVVDRLCKVQKTMQELIHPLRKEMRGGDPDKFKVYIDTKFQELDITKTLEALRETVDAQLERLVDKIMAVAEVDVEIMDVQSVVGQAACLAAEFEECLKSSGAKIEGIIKALKTSPAPTNSRASIAHRSTLSGGRSKGTRPPDKKQGTKTKSSKAPSAELTEDQMLEVEQIFDSLQAMLRVKPANIDIDLSECKEAIENLREGAKETMKHALQQLTDAAHTELEDLANEAAQRVGDIVGDVDFMDDEETSVIAGVMGSVASVASGAIAERRAEKERWRARSVAILSARRVATSVHGRLKSRVLAVLTRRQIAECEPGCRKLYNADHTLPVGLNSVLTTQESTDKGAMLKPDPSETSASERYMMGQIEMLLQLARSNSGGSGADAAPSGPKLDSRDDDNAAVARDAWLQNEAEVADDLQGRIDAVSAAFELAEKESDPLEKQARLVSCRMQQAALKQSAENCSAVSKQHGVPLEFLEGMQSQLAGMDSKLDNLQADVTAVRDDLRRLMGRPVLEVYEEWREAHLAKARRLPSGVYIESEVCRSGPQNNFKEDELDNPKMLVTSAFKEFMYGRAATVTCIHPAPAESGEELVEVELDGEVVEDFPDFLKVEATTPQGSRQAAGTKTKAKVPRRMVHLAPPRGQAEGGDAVQHAAASSSSGPPRGDAAGANDHLGEVSPGCRVYVDWKNVLLLSGPAGSGKSTAVEKLMFLILGEYYERRKHLDGITVVLISITLPKLNSPLDSVFEEGCRHAFGGRLRQTQQEELLELVQKADSKIEVVFLLDAYDELPNEARFRNLWRTNNLERFRDQVNEPLSHPKVLFTSRSEMFSGKQNYSRAFFPVESQQPNKDEEEKAMCFFDEIRLIEFGAKRYQYTQQHVAISFRDEFLKRFPVQSLRDREERSVVTQKLIENWAHEGSTWTWEACVILKVRGDGIKFDVRYVNDGLEGILTREQLRTMQGEPVGGEIKQNDKFKGPHVAMLSSIYATITADAVNAQSSPHEEDPDVVLQEKKWEVTSYEWFAELISQCASNHMEKDANLVEVASIVSILAAVGEFETDGENVASMLEFMKIMRASGLSDWTVRRYTKAFEEIPELAELTTTPFMTQIVTDILPALKGETQPRAIKGLLVLELGEAVAELAWGHLCSKDYLNLQKQLTTIQKDLDDRNSDGSNRWQVRIEMMAEQVRKKVEEMMAKNPSVWVKEMPTEVLAAATGEDSGGSDARVDGASLVALISKTVLRSLRRRPTRRSRIYSQFFNVFVDREIRKSSGRRGNIAPDTLEFEAPEYSRQLALYMTHKGATKLSQKVRSALFTDPSGVDKFFSDDPLTRAVRAAAPVKNSGGFLTFIHKTVQEHLVADAVADGILGAVKSTMLSSRRLQEAIFECLSSSNDSGVNSDEGVGNHSASYRKKRMTVDMLIEELKLSPAAYLALDVEPAIIDFISDRLLDEPAIVEALHTAAILAICASKLHRGSLGLLSENIGAILSSKMARRNSSTLLHVAASEGNERLVTMALHTMGLLMEASAKKRNTAASGDSRKDGTSMALLEGSAAETSSAHLQRLATQEDIIRFWQSAGASSELYSLDTRDESGKTALVRAVEFGDRKVVELLLKCGADWSLRPNLAGAVLDKSFVALADKPFDFVDQNSIPRKGMRLVARELRAAAYKGRPDDKPYFGGPFESDWVDKSGPGWRRSGNYGVVGVRKAAAPMDERDHVDFEEKYRREEAMLVWQKRGVFYFEVEIQERWVGERSKVCVGLSPHPQHCRFFRDYGHLGEPGRGTIGVEVPRPPTSEEEFRGLKDKQAPVWVSYPLPWGDFWSVQPVSDFEPSLENDGGLFTFRPKDDFDKLEFKLPASKIVWKSNESFIVVSVALDVGARKAHFFINGVELKDQTQSIPEGTSDLFPAISIANSGVRLRLNIGDRPFKYPDVIPGKKAVGFISLASGSHPVIIAAIRKHWDLCLDFVPRMKAEALLDVRGGPHEDSMLGLCLADANTSRAAKELAERLIEAGADVNIANCEFFTTPLMIALGNIAPLDIVKLLIAKGANVNYKGGVYTPLQKLFDGGGSSDRRLLILRHFLEKGVNINLTSLCRSDEFGDTALMQCCKQGHLDDADYEVMRLLLENGADASIHQDPHNPYTDEYDVPLTRASSRNNVRAVRLLLQYADIEKNRVDVEATDFDGRTSLHHAASGGHLEVAEVLLKAGGANVNKVKEKNGKTALVYAIEKGNLNMIDMLLRYGANISIRPKLTGKFLNDCLVRLASKPILQAGMRFTTVELKATAYEAGSSGEKPVFGGAFEEDFKVENKGSNNHNVLGVRKAAVPVDKRAGVYYFEVEVNQRWVGRRSKLCIGLSSHPQTRRRFEAYGHIGEAKGTLGYEIPIPTMDDTACQELVGKQVWIAYPMPWGDFWASQPLADYTSGSNEPFTFRPKQDFEKLEFRLPMSKIVWKANEEPFVVGVAFDVGAGKVHYFINGVQRHAQDVPEDLTGLFPAISSANSGINCQLNIGNRPFKYPTVLGEQKVDGFVALTSGDHPVIIAALHQHWDLCLDLVPRMTEKKLLDIQGGPDEETMLGLSLKHAGKSDTAKKVAEALINAGSNVNLESCYLFETPIVIGIRHSLPLDLLKLLIKKRADVNHRADVYTCLRWALGSVLGVRRVDSYVNSAVKLLLDNKADVNAEADGNDGIRRTMLAFVCCQEGGKFANPKLIKTLLENGADASKFDEFPLTGAATRGDLKVLKLLLECRDKNNVDVDAIDSDGRTALHHAASGGHLEVAEALLEARANVNSVKNRNGKTALVYAIEKGNLKMVDVLLRYGADISIRPKLQGRALCDNFVDLTGTNRGSWLETVPEGGMATCIKELPEEEKTLPFEEDFGEFTKALPCTSVPIFAVANAGVFYFEVEVEERWVGARSKLCIGVSPFWQYSRFFSESGHISKRPGTVGIEVPKPHMDDHVCRGLVNQEVWARWVSPFGQPFWRTAKASTELGALVDYRSAPEASFVFHGENGDSIVSPTDIVWKSPEAPFVVGVAVDMHAGKVHFHLDGKELSVQDIPKEELRRMRDEGMPIHGLFPAISGASCSARLCLNTGDHKFKHAPPGAKGFVTLAEGDHPAIIAALRKHWEICQRFVPIMKDAGIIDVRGGGEDASLLCLACYGRGDSEIAEHLSKQLIEAGADPNLGNRNQEGPLVRAIRASTKLDLLRLLIAKNADCNKAAAGGKWPLGVAAMNGHAKTVELLLDNGSDINDRSWMGGMTPLAVACENGARNGDVLETVRILLDRGADASLATDPSHDYVINGVVTKGGQGETPLHTAARTGFVDAVKLLLHAGKKNNVELDACNLESTPLTDAVRYGQVDVVKMLLDAGANPNYAKKASGTTVLMFGARNPAILRLLLAKKPQLDVRNLGSGATALALTILNRSEDCSESIKLLLDAGADPNLVSDGGHRDGSEKRLGATPLLFASEYGNSAVVELLLQSGKVRNVDAPRPFDGFTPLIAAAKEGHDQVVKLLLGHHADQAITDTAGKTALEHAQDAKHEAAVALLDSSKDGLK